MSLLQVTEYASKLVADERGLHKRAELINSHSSLERSNVLSFATRVTAHVRIEFLACVHPLGFKVGTH